MFGGNRSCLWLAVGLAAVLCGCAPKGGAAANGGQAAAPANPFQTQAQAAADGGGVQASAPAQAEGMATFSDPTENAFTVSVPQGWQVKGGVARKTPTEATIWVQALSPDGLTAVFIGDPSVPIFTLPSQQHGEGQMVQTAYGQQMALSFPGSPGFATMYAQRSFTKGCTDLQQRGGQPEPGLAQWTEAQAEAAKARAGNDIPVKTDFDAASAVFSCQANGAPIAAGVIVSTGMTRFGPGGIWTVPVLVGYRAPQAKQADADRLARAMFASLQKNPQWEEKNAAAARQSIAEIKANGARQMALLQQQEAQGSAMLRQQGETFAAQQQQRQTNFMNNFEGQRQARNAAFAQHEYDRDTNHQSEMRYIQNQTCAVWWDAAHTRCRYTVGN